MLYPDFPLPLPSPPLPSQVQGKYTQDKPIADLVVVIPLPKSMKSSSLNANYGNLKQDPLTKVLRWEIGEIREEKSPVLEGTIGLPNEFIPDEAPTITVPSLLRTQCLPHVLS